MGNFAAVTTGKAALINMCNGCFLEGITALLECKGRAAVEAHAGMIACTDFLVDAEFLLNNRLARF